jgi:hypothetical protein
MEAGPGAVQRTGERVPGAEMLLAFPPLPLRQPSPLTSLLLVALHAPLVPGIAEAVARTVGILRPLPSSASLSRYPHVGVMSLAYKPASGTSVQKAEPAIPEAARHAILSRNWGPLRYLGSGDQVSDLELNFKDGTVVLGCYTGPKRRSLQDAVIKSKKKVVFKLDGEGCGECSSDEVYVIELVQGENGKESLQVAKYVECHCMGDYNQCGEDAFYAFLEGEDEVPEGEEDEEEERRTAGDLHCRDGGVMSLVGKLALGTSVQKAEPAIPAHEAARHPILSRNWGPLRYAGSGKTDDDYVLKFKDDTIVLGCYTGPKRRSLQDAVIKSKKKVVFELDGEGCGECWSAEVYDIELVQDENGKESLRVEHYIECHCMGEYNTCEEDTYYAFLEGEDEAPEGEEEEGK